MQAKYDLSQSTGDNESLVWCKGKATGLLHTANMAALYLME